MDRLSVIKGFLIVVLLGFGTASYGQSHSQTLTNLQAGAIIEIPLTITKDMDLNFGSVVPGSTPGTITVSASASGSRTSTGGASILSQGTFSSACFSVTGGIGASYSITLPNSVTLSGPGSNTMTVTGFSENSTNTIKSNGTDTFYIGATLNVGAQQAKGTYTGSFNVSVNY